jgi:hypothetical protein
VRLVDLLDLAARELVEGVCEDLSSWGNEPVLIGSTSLDGTERAEWPVPLNVTVVSYLSTKIL